MWDDEQALDPTDPGAEPVLGVLLAARTGGEKILPFIREATPIGLIAGTAILSWKVGTGIRTKILKLGLPDPPLPKASPASGTLSFQLAGYSSVQNATPLPANGWLLTWWRGSSQWSAVNLSHGWGDACASLTGPPTDFRVLSGVSSLGWCEPAPVPVESYWLKENELNPAGPIEDYTSQPFDKQTFSWPDQPATQEQLESRTGAILESEEYRLLDPWYAHQLDPQTYEDPVEDQDEREECRPADSVPAGDPAPERGTDDFLDDPLRWRGRYDVVPAAEFPPNSIVPEDGLPAIGGQAYMRWGWASLNAKEAIDWEGWGYRKIVAKHGWGPTALEKTSEALFSTPVRKLDYDEYVGPRYPSRAGVLDACEWVVVVQREPLETSERPERSEEVPMGGIISAHGRYVS